MGRRFMSAVRVALTAALMVSLLQVQPAAAASTFEGGPDVDYSPRVVLNDHTPIKIRFTANGLQPNTTYRVKVRFTKSTSPGGSTNRGWTWNPETEKWAQEREGWLGPEVTTDAAGSISGNKAWVYAKFGDENVSGPYYLMVSLNYGGDGGSWNCDTPLPITVVDAKTEGSRLHNRMATGKPDTRVEATSNAQIEALQGTEPNYVDDDANGVKDDEDYGEPGSGGDYLLGVRASTLFDVIVNRVKPGTSVVSGGPDEDIAVGATDQEAPSAPTGLEGVASEGKVTLTWQPSTDDGTGVSGYRVYRWIEPLAGSTYTPAHELIGWTTETSLVDTTAVLNGVEYSYEVRAVDGDTNVSARSDTAKATAIWSPPSITAMITPGTPNGSNGWYRGATAPKIKLETTGTAFYSWDSAESAVTTYTGAVSASEGEHTLYFYAEDEYGNQSEVDEIAVRYDRTAPVAPKLSSPAFCTDASSSRRFEFSWSAKSSDTNRYDVQYKRDSGAWTSRRAATTRTADALTGVVGHTYYIRVRAIDIAGNVGPWTSAKATTIPYDNASMKFSSGWKTSKSTKYYNGSIRYATRRASATFTFHGGSDIHLISNVGPYRGKAAVYVDGKYVRTVNLYASSNAYRRPFYIKRVSGSGRHTVKVVALPQAKRPRVDIDGLSVKR